MDEDEDEILEDEEGPVPTLDVFGETHEQPTFECPDDPPPGWVELD